MRSSEIETLAPPSMRHQHNGRMQILGLRHNRKRATVPNSTYNRTSFKQTPLSTGRNLSFRSETVVDGRVVRLSMREYNGI